MPDARRELQTIRPTSHTTALGALFIPEEGEERKGEIAGSESLPVWFGQDGHLGGGGQECPPHMSPNCPPIRITGIPGSRTWRAVRRSWSERGERLRGTSRSSRTFDSRSRGPRRCAEHFSDGRLPLD